MPLDTTQPARHLAQGKYFYGAPGTPFIDAGEAWFWTLDCLEARTQLSRGCASLKVGRPCEPDDVVNAMARLHLPPIHARTMVSWGRRRVVPPLATEARRLWDEVIARLSVVLVVRGIVRVPPLGTHALGPSSRGSAQGHVSAADRREQDAALMDVPLTGLRSSPLPPDDAGAGDLDRALEKLGAAVMERGLG